jgi:cytochrome c oxidase cbb3-type subunit 3
MTNPHDPSEEPQFSPDGVPIIPGPDGINELDNPMPRWMAAVFGVTILWGVGYLVLFPGVGLNLLGYGQYKVYEAEMAEAKSKYQAKAPADPQAALAAAIGNAGAIAAGKALYAANCAACHGAEAKGAIGPNLTDDTWLYGGKPDQVAHTIGNGTAKGMPPFQSSLSAEQLAQVTAFVKSFKP